jgi:polysaccharide chain length determinant protein (PEP-CTERM system associated)
MHDVIQQILGYAIAAWRRRWVALIAAWAVCMAGWVLVERIPNTYQSSARIFIDTESLLDQLMGGLAVSVDRNLISELEVVRRSLTSRPNLEQVMRETDLDLQANSPADVERMVNEINRNLSISRDRNNFFTIRYTDQDAELSYNIVQSVLNIFIESNLGSNRDDMAVTTRFITDQMNRAQEELQRLERQLTQFEIENRGFLPGSENYEARRRAAQVNLARLEQEREEAIAEVERLNENLARTREEVRGQSPGLSPRAQRIEQLEAQITELLLRYTEQHPEVVLTRRLLERERAQLEEEGAFGEAQNTSPVIEQLRSMISRQEAAIESYEQRMDQLQSDISELSALIEQAPAVMSDYRQLQREIDAVRGNLRALRERRERLQFREDMEANVDSVQFRIVEPPQVPVTPSGPNRMLLRSAVLVGGLGAGAGFALFLGLLANTITTTGRLEQITKRPTLGNVTRIRMPYEMPRRLLELGAFASVFIGLISVFAGIVMGYGSGVLNQLT